MVKVTFALIFFFLTSCTATDRNQGDYSEYAQRKLIKLEQSDTTANLFIYEGSVALICIPVPVLQSYIDENLTDEDLCEEKKKDLKKTEEGNPYFGRRS